MVVVWHFHAHLVYHYVAFSAFVSLHLVAQDPDSFSIFKLLNLPIQLTPVWCIALSYLESYGSYLTTDPAPTGGSSNHVTVNVDIWPHFQHRPRARSYHVSKSQQ